MENKWVTEVATTGNNRKAMGEQGKQIENDPETKRTIENQANNRQNHETNKPKQSGTIENQGGNNRKPKRIQ